MGNTLELSDDGQHTPMGRVDPFIGRSLRHYEVIECIGQGGMSVVYRGRDHRLHRDVAIKVLHPFLAEKAECRLRLAREARAVARLEHENILRIFDFSGESPTLNERPGSERNHGDRDGFLVTELVVGDTLKHFAHDHELWRVPEVGALAVLQLARALDHAHTSGVIHRDLKPENVMVRRDGVLKLMDFGIAQVVDSKSLTVTGTLLGSPAHMAPECIEGFAADERSDLFSLGTILYWLVTGALPFEANTPHALLKAIVDGRFAPAQQRNARVSDAIARVIQRALATAPDARYPDAKSMASDLASTLVGVGIDPTAATTERVLADPSTTLDVIEHGVRAACLKESERLLDHDEPARAMSMLSRVIASHPGDPEAMALLERVQLGVDDEQEVFAAADLDAEDGPAQQPTLTVRRAAPFIAASGIAMLLGLVVTISDVVERGNVDDEVGTEAKPVAAPDMSFGAPHDDDAAKLKARQGAVADAVRRDVASDVRRARLNPTMPTPRGGTRSDLVPVAQRLQVTPNQVEPPDPSVDATNAVDVNVKTRMVEVRVFPPAKLIVDDQAPIDVFRDVKVPLPPGPHTLRFSKPSAVAETRHIVVPEEGPMAPVVVQLEPAPAEFVVDTVGVEASVAIRPVGSSSDKLVPGPHDGRRGAPVFFEKDASGKFIGTLVYEVTATAKGHRPRTELVKLSAGKTTRLRLVLEPAANDARTNGSGTQPGQP